MRTLVVSDLHLGARGAPDVLRRAAGREALVAALGDVDRLVLLGDVLELRHGPAAQALEAAAEPLEELGAALAGREVVVVPGNHDHGLLRDWLADRRELGLEERVAAAQASPAAAALAELLAPARVELAYPGLFVRPDVYATHGHYLDLHTTVPLIERLGAGMMARLAGSPPRRGARPADYEAVLAPLYAWVDSAAAWTPEGRGAAGAGRSADLWTRLSGGGTRPLRFRALAAALPVLVAAANRGGLGPLEADLSGAALRAGGLRGMRAVVARLAVPAAHVVFGHTHRSGPLPGDDLGEWVAGGTRLHNAGSWTFEPRFVGTRGPAGPYWPGSAIEVGDDGPPVLRRLLGDLPAQALRPPGPA